MTILNNPIKEQRNPVSPPDTPTPTDALAARDAQIGKNSLPGGLVDMGKWAMEAAEMFGIDRKTIGTMLLKSVLTGKLELPGMKSETAKRKKMEVIVDQIIKLILTCFGIFMGYKIFELLVTLLVVVP